MVAQSEGKGTATAAAAGAAQYVGLREGDGDGKPGCCARCCTWRCVGWSSLGCGIAALLGAAIFAALYLWPSGEDYDCDGDGVDDCGVFDYSVSLCANRPTCGRYAKARDLTLGQSCRCRRCNGAEFDGTAFADGKLVEGGSSAFNAKKWGRFKNWANHQETCAPWIMPRDEQAMRQVMSYAKDKGYKVRICGTAHSAGGLVTDGKDSSVLVVSMGEFASSDPEWEFGLREMPDGSARATINAGWTLMHLFAKARPHGFFLPTFPAGYYFSLGGIVANTVHGGGYRAGFVYTYVTRLRVMTHDGTVSIVDTEEDLRHWRGSFGLLGVILGIEFSLVKRDNLQMYTVTKNLGSWSEADLWDFVKGEADADVPKELTPGGVEGKRTAFYAQYFVDFVNSGGGGPKIMAYSQKANESVDDDFGGQLDMPRRAEENYQDMLEMPIFLDGHGSMTYADATRRDGSPPLVIAGIDMNKVMKSFNWFPMAKMMSWSALVGIPFYVRDYRNKVNDGFIQQRTPAALASAYLFKPNDLFKALDVLRKIQLESLSSTEFMWNLPGEFRFIEVEDVSTLQPVPAGLYAAIEMMSFEDLSENDQAWKRDFKRVEDAWINELGAKPHLGKLFAFGSTEDDDGSIEAFQDAGRICSVYSPAQKAEFEAYRARVDPGGLFASGLGMQLLEPCATEPESLPSSGDIVA